MLDEDVRTQVNGNKYRAVRARDRIPSFPHRSIIRFIEYSIGIFIESSILYLTIGIAKMEATTRQNEQIIIWHTDRTTDLAPEYRQE
jgi:hypothetical protein